MFIIQAILLITLLKNNFCQDINQYFENINKNVLRFNQKSAEITWKSSIDPGNPDIETEAEILLKEKIKWQHETCDRLATLKNHQSLNVTQMRQTYLLCRGPKYSFDEAKLVLKLTEKLQTIYSEAKTCIPTEKVLSDDLIEIESAILKYIKPVGHFLKIESPEDSQVELKNIFCLKGEDDFEKLMEFSRNKAVLKWLWTSWREVVGPPTKNTYKQLVALENRAAKRNGYPNIGVAWRDELEVPNLRGICRQLYKRIRPMYTLLHGIIRFYLRQHYGDIVPERDYIPAHLLGNLWSQNWEPLIDLILGKDIDLNLNIKKSNWTVMHMAKRAEDFYQSFGLPAMTDTFWNKSVFTKENGQKRCHGTAADMFQKDDYRLIYCSNTTIEDFYVLNHEMGHIQYFKAYENKPALFREANSALHETIGDTVMMGAMNPQHLHRLGLINDSQLFENKNKPEDSQGNLDQGHRKEEFQRNKKDDPYQNTDFMKKREFKLRTFENEIFKSTDDILLLKQALNLVPQIPFSLLIDEYRWTYFEGGRRPMDMTNSGFWKIATELQGIAPPMKRGDEFFDISAIFHVSDNTPYIRYYLSHILRYQLFDALCRASVFGKRNSKDPLPESIPLHRCDIYGSKTAGKLLQDIMSRGNSQDLLTILQETLGESISAEPFRNYYQPLIDLLLKLVERYQIPLGW